MSERASSDGMDHQLGALRPAAPSDVLMARLRASRPAMHRALAPSTSSAHPVRPARWRSLTAVAAALVVAATLAGLPRGGRRAPVLSARPAASAGAEGATQAAVRPMNVPAAPVFLPVETRSHLVSLQPVRTIQNPDEAPQRLFRALIIEDTTAVGAETDAALHLRRAREVYLPVRSPVY